MYSEARLEDLSFYSLLAVLQAGMWLQSDLEKFCEPFGLSHGRFSILLAILDKTEGGVIGNELATRLGVAKPTITKMVTKLIDDGFIESVTDTSDSRKKRYSITGKASALLDNVVPGYVRRLREMTAGLTKDDKHHLLETLSKINFLDPSKAILRKRTKSITEKGAEIRALCRSGTEEDIDLVLSYLDDDVDIPTTKLVDFYLGTVDTTDGLRRIEHYLFNGSQIQRNYCTLFFARRNEWRLVNRAYEMGLIDRVQAFSR